jgi:hypothetical protein
MDVLHLIYPESQRQQCQQQKCLVKALQIKGVMLALAALSARHRRGCEPAPALSSCLRVGGVVVATATPAKFGDRASNASIASHGFVSRSGISTHVRRRVDGCSRARVGGRERLNTHRGRHRLRGCITPHAWCFQGSGLGRGSDECRGKGQCLKRQQWKYFRLPIARPGNIPRRRPRCGSPGPCRPA